MEQNKKTTVAVVLVVASVFSWIVLLSYGDDADPIISESLGHILGVLLALLIPATCWAFTFAIIAARNQKRPDNSLSLALAFIVASLVPGLAISLASGLLWPLVLATLLGTIFSIGPFSILNRVQLKDEGSNRGDQKRNGPD